MTHSEVPGETPATALFTFSYLLKSAGWADASLRASGCSVDMGVSYLTDSLRDLLGAVNSILGGASASTASWWNEPGELTWRFERVGGEVAMTVLTGDEVRPASEAMSVRAPADEIFRPLVLEVEQVLLDFGEVDYWLSWQYMFPIAALREAQKRLGMVRRPIPAQVATRFDPLLAPAIDLWTKYLRAEVEADVVVAWANEQLDGRREVDEVTSTVLHLVADVSAVSNLPLDIRGRSWARRRAWECEFRSAHEFHPRV